MLKEHLKIGELYKFKRDWTVESIDGIKRIQILPGHVALLLEIRENFDKLETTYIKMIYDGKIIFRTGINTQAVNDLELIKCEEY